MFFTLGTPVTEKEDPAFEYFVAKIDNQPNQNQLFKEACTYIRNKYPQATPRSHYYNRTAQSTSPTDLYFIRHLTWNSCIPPYGDPELPDYEKAALEFVREKLKNQSDNANEEQSSLISWCSIL